MKVDLESALSLVDDAAAVLFASESNVRAVGVGRVEDGYGFRVIYNEAVFLALASSEGPLTEFEHVPISRVGIDGDIDPLAGVSQPGPGGSGPGVPVPVPERQRHNRLCCGLEIQNWDYNSQAGKLTEDAVIFGSLGCFVKLSDDSPALLSNNHVIAGLNQGVLGSDRIVQPTSLAPVPSGHVATLTASRPILPAPVGIPFDPQHPDMNKIDAAVAALQHPSRFVQGYLLARNLPTISGTTAPVLLDEVFKVGRTTGETRGEISAIGTNVTVSYPNMGAAWFNNGFEIEGENGTVFAEPGDSGSAIVTRDGKVMGLLIAGSGNLAYACTIDNVLQELGCTLAL